MSPELQNPVSFRFFHVYRYVFEREVPSLGRNVLLFPALPSRLRYLIHKTVEDLPELTTFSVGESWYRRVVVCHSELRSELQGDSDLESSPSVADDRFRSREEMQGAAKLKPSTPSRNRPPRRPDKAVYVPRAARERLHQQNSPAPSGDQEVPSPASLSCSCTARLCDSETAGPCACAEEPPPSIADGILNHAGEAPALSPLGEKQDLPSRPQGAKPPDWEQTVSCFSEMSLHEEEPDVVPHGATMEGRNVSADDLIEEIKAHLKEPAAVSVEHVLEDYSMYENVSFNPEDFRHVIEIYDFPASLKTDDLLDAFAAYSDGGMKIIWVDNRHALGVFSSESAALNALSIEHPLVKACALVEGTKKAKAKAIRRAEFIQPVKERPRTDSAVARRMVTRALGLPGRGRAQRY